MTSLAPALKPSAVLGLLSLAMLLIAIAIFVSWGVALSALLLICGALIAVAPILALSLSSMTLSYFVFVTFLVGTIQYYSGIAASSYLGFLALALMLVHIGFAVGRTMLTVSFSTGLVVLIILYSVITSISANHPLQHSMLALIVYFAPFTLCCFLPSFFVTEEGLVTLRRLIFVFALLPLVQVWFAVHQRLVLGQGTTSWDSVTGTFGGSILGTGPNTVLMISLIISTLLIIFLSRRGFVSRGTLIAVIIAVVVSTALGETKAMFIMMPLALLVQNARQVRQRPVLLVVGALLLLGGLVAMQAWYEMFNYGARYGEQVQMTFTERAASVWENQTGSQVKLDLYDRRTRLETLVFWDQATASDYFTRIFGAGLGASRSGFTGDGSAAAIYSAEVLNTTAVSQLLWDGGIVLLLLFTLIFLTAIARLQIAFFKAESEGARDFIVTIQAALLILLGSIFYKNVLLEHLAMQSLAGFILCIAFLPTMFFDKIFESVREDTISRC